MHVSCAHGGKIRKQASIVAVESLENSTLLRLVTCRWNEREIKVGDELVAIDGKEATSLAEALKVRQNYSFARTLMEGCKMFRQLLECFAALHECQFEPLPDCLPLAWY